MITPITVRKERSLLSRSVASANQRFSRMSFLNNFIVLVRRPLTVSAQGLNWIQPRGFPRRYDAGKNPHASRRRESPEHRKYRKISRKESCGNNLAHYPRQKYTRRSANRGQGYGFQQELFEYVRLACAQRFSQSDFLGPLGDRNQHDIHDDDGAHDQRNSGHEDGHQKDRAEEAIAQARDGVGCDNAEVVFFVEPQATTRSHYESRFLYCFVKGFVSFRSRGEIKRPLPDQRTVVKAIGFQRDHDKAVLRNAKHRSLYFLHSDHPVRQSANIDLTPNGIAGREQFSSDVSPYVGDARCAVSFG